MSDILTSISKRLQTDLADVARASIDPRFSQQLTEANFRDKAFQKERKAALEDAAKLRAQQLADQRRSEQAKIQTWAFEQAYQEGINTGNWTPVANFLEQPGIQAPIREQATRTLDMRLPQGQEGVLRAAQIDKTLADMSNNEIRIQLDKRRLNNEDIRMVNERIDVQWQRDYDKAKELINEQTEVTNINQLVRHLEGSKGVFTDEEIENTADAMRNAVDSKNAKIIYDRAWDFANARHIQERKDARNQAQVEAMGEKPSGLSGGEITEAKAFLGPVLDRAMEKDGELRDYLDDDFVDFWFGKDKEIVQQNRGRAVIGAARIAKTLGRNLEDASDPFLKDAFKLILLTGQTEIGGQKVIDPNLASQLASELARIQLTDSRFTLNALVTKIEQNPDASPREALNDMKRRAGIQ